MSIFFGLSWHFEREKPFFGKHLYCKTRTDYTYIVYKTSRLVRISVFNQQPKQRVFFSGKLFYKSNRKLFSCVCIAWYKHSRRWENSRRLCKPSTSPRVYITVSNSPNPSRICIRLCKHGKPFLLLNFSTNHIFKAIRFRIQAILRSVYFFVIFKPVKLLR